MTTKRLQMVVSYTVEVEIDARVSDADLEWGVSRAFNEVSDGRMPFSAELAQRGVGECAHDALRTAVGALAGRIAERYPGARGRTYEIERRIVEPTIARLEKVVDVRTGPVPPEMCRCGEPLVTEVGYDGWDRCIHCGSS